MWRDRRGAGIAEYALLLLIIVVVGAVAFKFIGGNVKRAGSRTNEQFAGGSGSGEGDKGATKGAGDKSKTGGKGGDKSAAGGGATEQGGQGGGAASAGGGGAQVSQNDTNSSGEEQPAEERKTPLWKILGGVFVLLFGIAGYFAFRKSKSAG